MPVNLTIRAEVVDISSDEPTSSDSFFVDTNVWYWMTYTKASTTARSYQVTSYPTYTNKVLNAKAKLFQSGLSLAELAHLIERDERDIYNASNAPELSTKEYRHNLPAERQVVCQEVETACVQIIALADPLEIKIDETTSSSIISRFSTDSVDGYDLFILESMKLNGVMQVITDDGDFATASGIRVFTANKTVLEAARNQGKLVKR